MRRKCRDSIRHMSKKYHTASMHLPKGSNWMDDLRKEIVRNPVAESSTVNR